MRRSTWLGLGVGLGFGLGLGVGVGVGLGLGLDGDEEEHRPVRQPGAFEDQSNLLTEMQVLAGRGRRREREGRHGDHRAGNDCGCNPRASGAVRTTVSGRRGAELQRRAARALLLHWQRDVCCAEAGRGVDAAADQHGNARASFREGSMRYDDTITSENTGFTCINGQ